MAKKYGIGANSGKQSSKYQAIAPDGSILKKSSFNIHDEKALMGMYLYENKWFASGIVTEPQDWGTQIFVEAIKIN